MTNQTPRAQTATSDLYREERAYCPRCKTTLQPVEYDRSLLRCPTCTERGIASRYVASLIERTDGSVLCCWSSEEDGWVLPYARLHVDETLDQAQRRTMEELGLHILGRALVYEAPSNRIHGESEYSYCVVYRVTVSDVDTLNLRDLGWLTRADILRRSPRAIFYRNLFLHVPPSEGPGPSYDAALDAASRWMEAQATAADARASLASVIRQFASEHAAAMEETHRIDTVVRLERIGALQRQCHQLEQSLQHVTEPVAALAQRIDAIEYDRGRSDERQDVLRYILSAAEQYQIDKWDQIADAARRFAQCLLECAHRKNR